MAAWRIKSAELKRLRIEKMLDRAELARTTGVSTRALSDLEKTDKGVTTSTLDALTKALGCKRADIATSAESTDKKNANGAASALAKSAAALASLPAHLTPHGAPVLPAPRRPIDRPRMIDLRRLESALPPAPTLEVDGVHLPKLTVVKYSQCFTAYLARDGERYWTEGKLVDERGLPPPEAALLGAKSGNAGRFDLHCPVGDAGDTLAVTVHTNDAKTTIAMQDGAEKNVQCVVRVVALKELAEGAGLLFFMRERPSPWGLVVERVIRVTPCERNARTRSARAR